MGNKMLKHENNRYTPVGGKDPPPSSAKFTGFKGGGLYLDIAIPWDFRLGGSLRPETTRFPMISFVKTRPSVVKTPPMNTEIT